MARSLASLSDIFNVMIASLLLLLSMRRFVSMLILLLNKCQGLKELRVFCADVRGFSYGTSERKRVECN
jgi:hypothetical protein